MVVILLLAAVGVLVFFGYMGYMVCLAVGGEMRRAKVLERGEPGWARIQGWERTGWSQGKKDILRFSLAIQPDAGGPGWMGTAERCVQMMEVPQFQVGMDRRVRILREGASVRVEFE
ncbi:hypothetical protein [Chondromyces apiculatus]|uniref:Uncharacterized protein n=1 Tax=Chondromyces apiculatus DSM 436 TaxID=1192034 RepID=A0A017T7V4_9BACT|nr:hypothetical protein [Chondromyces apiculatus]EYF04890.1 Hypothetical protein CAP_3701 [Chondromyces apiculatus DSM 436]